jgi:ABC-type Zn uptake system ZnuABC Zn-binding protein ZnuA
MHTSRLFVLLMLLGSFSAQAQLAGRRPLVVATASIFADMAAVISGDLVEVKTVVPIGADPHVYEPTPADVRLVAQADLILKNGLTFEGWLNELIANSGARAEVVTITEGIEPIGSDKYKNAYDPHAWMSAHNGRQYIRNIRDALARLDPANADVYDFNYRLYDQQLADLDAYIQQRINSIPPKQRVLATSHDAFRYYGRRYGLRVEAVLGTSTDAEVQTADIMRLNRVLIETQAPAVFVETTVNPKLLRQIAEDNGIAIGGSLYADSLGDPDSPAATYINMLRHNTDVIVGALLPNTAAPAAAPPFDAGAPWLLALMGLLMAGSFAFMVYRLNVRI